MPYTTAHGLLTILGDSCTQSEIWQTGVRLVGGQGAPTEAEFAAYDGAINTFLNNPELKFPNLFRYIGLKWAPQDVEGKYGADGEAVEWLRPVPKTGGSSGGYPQIACVLSLRTGRTRGYASNGRMYFPSAATPNSDGKIMLTESTSIQTAGAQLMAAITAVDNGAPAVMSTVGAGRTELVTGVRVGRVMDTQRRRRNALDESFGVATPVPS